MFFDAEGQGNVLCRVDSAQPGVVSIKWYFPALVNQEGFNVYRKNQMSSDWIRLNSAPVLPGTYAPPDSALRADKQLGSYIKLAKDIRNVKDLALLALILKSFRSNELSNNLGIWFTDTSVKQAAVQYKVCLIKESKDTECSLSDEFFPNSFEKISAPQNIVYKVLGKKISFKWKPEINRYFGVDIFRKNPGTDFVKITEDPVIISQTTQLNGEKGLGETFYLDTGLTPGSNYEYFLTAIDFFGIASAKSQIIKICLKDVDAPLPPTDISINIHKENVSLRWKNRHPEVDLAGYNVYRKGLTDSIYIKVNNTIINIKDTLYLDSLRNCDSYQYQVSSIDTAGNEKRSNPFAITVSDTRPPRKPSGFIITSDTGIVNLNWNKNTENDLSGYSIYRSVSIAPEFFVKITPQQVKENIYVDKMPVNIKNKIFYKIAAIDESGNKSDYSDILQVTLPDIIAPAMPFIKTCFLATDIITIEWLANSEPDLSGYLVFRKVIGDSINPAAQINKKLIAGQFTRYIDRSIERGKGYEYYLVAIDSSMNVSRKSNVYKIKVGEEINKIVKLKFVKARYNRKRRVIDLKWRLADESGILGYVVYRQNAIENSLSSITGLIRDETLSDKSILNNNKYNYQVRVYNLKGDVSRSEIISVDTND